LMVGAKVLQNGHSKSEYSIRVILAFLLPRIWSAFVIAFGFLETTLGAACAGCFASPAAAEGAVFFSRVATLLVRDPRKNAAMTSAIVKDLLKDLRLSVSEAMG